MFTMILQLYLESGEYQVESIGSPNFIDYCYSIYSKSNTVDLNSIKNKRDIR